MNIEVIMMFALALYTIAVWICIYFFVFRKINKEKRCKMCTVGKVIGVSAIKYGGIHIPLVEYSVDGKKYKTAGPKFQYGAVTTVSTPFADMKTKYETNITTRTNLPKYIKVKIRKNSSVSFSASPLFDLYPIGSEVNVFYNDKKPKDSYVERFEGVSKWITILLLFIGVCFTIMFVCAVIRLVIVLK